MLQVTPKVKEDRESRTAPAANLLPRPVPEPAAADAVGPKKSVHPLPAPPPKSNPSPASGSSLTEGQRRQTRVPAILGEVTFRGLIAVDGIISGQPGGSGGSTSLRQHGRSFFGTDPELNGEITFVDMIRVNGHIAGSVHSRKGTLMVDQAARVDANVDVAIAVVAGIVTGDIVAHQRVELAPSARIYGNIWTRSLVIQSGAIFEGVCQRLEDDKDS